MEKIEIMNISIKININEENQKISWKIPKSILSTIILSHY
jgi:hypothetical protein